MLPAAGTSSRCAGKIERKKEDIMLAQLIKVMPPVDVLGEAVERWSDDAWSLPARPRPLGRLEESAEPSPLRLLQESRF